MSIHPIKGFWDASGFFVIINKREYLCIVFLKFLFCSVGDLTHAPFLGKYSTTELPSSTTYVKFFLWKHKFFIFFFGEFLGVRYEKYMLNFI
jgi:hypothetical protein